MNEERFQDLVEYVQSTSANPPEHLFSGGYEDWHCRARLAQFLSMEGIDKTDEAIELFKSIEDIKNASVEELAQIEGLNKRVAENIYNYFRKGE